MCASGGRTGGEEISSLVLDGDADRAREVGEPNALSDMKARSFLGVVGIEAAPLLPWSLLLLRLMTLPSVRERASMRRARETSGFEEVRVGRTGDT